MTLLQNIRYGCIVMGLWFMFSGFIISENLLLGFFGVTCIMITPISLMIDRKKQNTLNNIPKEIMCDE